MSRNLVTASSSIWYQRKGTVDFCAKVTTRSGSKICILGRIHLDIQTSCEIFKMYFYLAHGDLVLQLLRCFGDLKEKHVIMQYPIQVVHT